jgi:putative FmdB family regulatory protein
MPLYEYKCAKCGDVFEVRQHFSDEPLTAHSVCGGAVERLISVPTFQFKGSGFYITDYGRKGSNGSNGSNGSKKKSEKASPEPAAAATKSESAPAK